MTCKGGRTGGHGWPLMAMGGQAVAMGDYGCNYGLAYDHAAGQEEVGRYYCQLTGASRWGYGLWSWSGPRLRGQNSEDGYTIHATRSEVEPSGRSQEDGIVDGGRRRLGESDRATDRASSVSFRFSHRTFTSRRETITHAITISGNSGIYSRFI